MRRLFLVRVFPLVVALLAACAGDVRESGDATGSVRSPLQSERSELRIAVVGAGASGLTAAYTLKELGYKNVTVFEKEGRVGGKVNSFSAGGVNAELGAVFASPDYKLVLGLADKFGVPYAPYASPRLILDEAGKKHTFPGFLLSRYTPAEIALATRNYAIALQKFSDIEKDGFAGLPRELAKPFDKFAEDHGFTPIAEMIRSLMVGFGYGYYETAPAAYFMKLAPWLVKVGPNGLESPPYYVFPLGFQSLWEKVAQQLDVRLNATVTNIERGDDKGNESDCRGQIRITINKSEQHTFDAVIISTPLNVVSRFMKLSKLEEALFEQVQSNRYFVTLFTAANLTGEETLFIHEHGWQEKRNHVAVWSNREQANPVFIGYQVADGTTEAPQIAATLAEDVSRLGGGTFGQALIQKEWDYFPHVSSWVFGLGYYDGIELYLQGRQNTYYVGSTLSFETVEHGARYARALVQRRFAAVR